MLMRDPQAILWDFRCHVTWQRGHLCPTRPVALDALFSQRNKYFSRCFVPQYAAHASISLRRFSSASFRRYACSAFVPDDVHERRLGDFAREAANIPARSRKLERKPWTAASSIFMRRNTISIAIVDNGSLRACPAKTKSPALSFSSWRTIATARGDNRARCSRPAFIRPAGTVQILCRGRFRPTAFPRFHRSARQSGCTVRAPSLKWARLDYSLWRCGARYERWIGKIAPLEPAKQLWTSTLFKKTLHPHKWTQTVIQA